MATLLGAISSRISRSVRTVTGHVLNNSVKTISSNQSIFASLSISTFGSGRPVLSLPKLHPQHTAKRFGHCFPQFAALPPINPVAGKGDVYQTKIERKRTIKDPNEPNLQHIEALKWTTWRMLRDVRRRHVFMRYHLNRSSMQNIYKCRTLPKSIREVAFDEAKDRLPRDSRFHHLRNRCAISGRSRGVVKKYRLSRLVWRNLADYNKLSGVIKACWH